MSTTDEPRSEERALYRAFRDRVIQTIEADLARERIEAEALRAEVVGALRDAIATARANQSIGPVVLFGSFAWGQPFAHSDVDLLVEDADEDMVIRVAESATSRPLHVLTRKSAPPSLMSRVLRDGVVL